MSTAVRLIGITGKKFNGKDTLGNFFVTRHKYKRLAFADPLKEACKCIFGFNDDQLYGDKKETIDDFWKTSPRIILQYLGTDLFRNQLVNIMPHLGNDIWVEVVRKQILNGWESDKETCFVVTDVRFPNEVKMIKDLGGIMFRVKRDDKSSTDSHISEAHIDNLYVDQELLNDGTKEELYEKSMNFISSLDRVKSNDN